MRTTTKSESKTSKISKVQIHASTHSYPVYIGSGAVEKAAGLLNSVPKATASAQAIVIADEKLRAARKVLLQTLRRAGWSVSEIAVAAGERFKDIESVFPIFGELLKMKADRDSVIFALGGGSIGDAAGFIASTYLRGVAWVGVPTTLLAQVDSSVGGKTGINHSTGKNLIGSFHQPGAVICDLDFLQTLSQREVISGLGEALKYGLIYDPQFLKFLIENWSGAVKLNPKILSRIVTTSLRWKGQVVEQDEFDRKGIREALNFGHTFGHAIEKATGYGEFQHGEAVLWGMRFATNLSFVRGHLKAKDFAAASEALSGIQLTALPKKQKFGDYLKYMASDKKLRNGSVHFVLLKKIGKVISDGKVTPADLKKSYKMLGKYGAS